MTGITTRVAFVWCIVTRVVALLVVQQDPVKRVSDLVLTFKREAAYFQTN